MAQPNTTATPAGLAPAVDATNGRPGPVAADPLRLSRCPACTYDLTGLPDAGQCPECGEAYDRDADEVVFFGTADGQLATVASGGRGSVAAHVAIFALLFAPGLLLGRGNFLDYVGSDPFLLLMLGFFGLQFALMLAIRSAAPAAGLVRVRVGADGFEQSSTAPPDSPAWRLLNALRLVGFVSWVGYMVTQGFAARYAVLWVFMAFAAVTFVARTWRRWTGRDDPASAPVDRLDQRASTLRPWSAVRQAQVNSRRDGRFRLYLSGVGWFDPVEYVNALLPIRRDQADALGERIDRWRGVAEAKKAPAKRSVWRRLGSQVGRWNGERRR